jgi:hypothetical protein
MARTLGDDADDMLVALLIAWILGPFVLLALLLTAQRVIAQRRRSPIGGFQVRRRASVPASGG